MDKAFVEEEGWRKRRKQVVIKRGPRSSSQDIGLRCDVLLIYEHIAEFTAKFVLSRNDDGDVLPTEVYETRGDTCHYWKGGRQRSTIDQPMAEEGTSQGNNSQS